MEVNFGRDGLPLSRLQWRVLFAVYLAIGVWNCGKKEPRPSYPSPPTVATQKPATTPLTVVRVLLTEGFDTIQLRWTRQGEVVRVQVAENELLLLVRHGENWKRLEINSGFRLESAAGRLLEVQGRHYRGFIEVFINPVGVPVVVNEVRLEEYLRGVVPNELGPRKFPQLEAQKAQAVAARTFARKSLGSFARFGFDLYSDQRSQSYQGADSEEALSNRGVRETQGVVATFGGEPILAMYSSTCGGMTEAFHQIFKGGPIDYLKGSAACNDERSPYHSWEERIDIHKNQSRMAKYANVGPITRLEPLQRSEAGRIVQMRFVGEKGDIVLAGNDIRFALGLRSNWITAMKPIRNASGTITELLVRGKGWGHGVGMCQIGAVDLSEKGKGYADILRHYYKGIDLSTLQ
jgi:stage II sporulation protein D